MSIGQRTCASICACSNGGDCDCGMCSPTESMASGVEPSGLAIGFALASGVAAVLMVSLCFMVVALQADKALERATEVRK